MGRWSSRLSISSRKDVSGAGKADGGQGEVRVVKATRQRQTKGWGLGDPSEWMGGRRVGEAHPPQRAPMQAAGSRGGAG
jgi:hypothetical protein